MNVMKHSVLLFLAAIAYVAIPAYAKDKNPIATPCHTLIAKLSEITARFEASPSDVSMEQHLARMQQLQDWMKQLDECVVNMPDQLTPKDWQNAVFIEGKLEGEFFRTSAAIDSQSGSSALATLSQSCRANYQRWQDDYNDLAHKYNDLVRDYNGQRDIIVRMVAAPPPLPPARQIVHCSTFSSGNIGWIDCY
jgi:hypothetical protein